MAILLILPNCFLLIGCQGEFQENSESKLHINPIGQDEQYMLHELHLPLDSLPNLDPYTIENPSHWIPLYQMMEGLFRIASDGGIEYGLAKGWSVSPDYKAWRFQIRDAKWSDGTPIRAEDFLITWKWIQKKEYKTLYQWILQERISEMKVNDEGSLQIIMKQPEPDLIQWLATIPFYPMAPSFDEDQPLVISNGPFRLTENTATQLILVKNQNYWDSPHVKLDRVIFHLLPDEREQLAAYQAGKLHLLSLEKLPYPSYQLKGTQLQIPVPIIHYLQFNPRISLNYKEVRHYLDWSLNNEELLGTLQLSQHQRLHQWLQVLPDFFLNQAKREVTRVEDHKFEAMEELVLLAQWNRRNWEEGQVIKSQLQAAGIPIQVVLVDQNQWKEERQHGEYSFIIGEFTPLINDPIHLFQSIVHLSGDSLSLQKEKEYQELLEQAVRSENIDVRADAFGDVDLFLLGDSSILPLYLEYRQVQQVDSLHELRFQRITGIYDCKYAFIQ